jgi:transposase
MDNMPHEPDYVIVGVDTHADDHVAVVLSSLGEVRGGRAFPATRAGYARLIEWASSLGVIDRIGIEGTGSWGRGLSLFCLSRGLAVRDVDRPDRRTRRRKGKTDLVDAEAAARAVLAGTATTLPKTGDGPVEMIRVLHITRETAVKARTQAINQLRALVVTAPLELAEQLRGLSSRQLVATATCFGTTTPIVDPAAATRLAMRSLARRIEQLDDEIDRLETERDRLVDDAAPALLETKGVGYHSAATLLIAAGDNPERITSEAAFREPVRHRTRARQLRPLPPPPAQPRRPPASQPSTAHHRGVTDPLARPTHPRPRHPPQPQRRVQSRPRHPPPPQALHRPRGLPARHRRTQHTARRHHPSRLTSIGTSEALQPPRRQHDRPLVTS